MPCWRCDAALATISNTWFLCDDCLDFERDVRAAERAAAAIPDSPEPVGRTSKGERADSPPKAGSERPEPLDLSSQSPPPGARPERDPAQHLEPETVADLRRILSEQTPPQGAIERWIHGHYRQQELRNLITNPFYTEPVAVGGYLSNVDPGDEQA